MDDTMARERADPVLRRLVEVMDPIPAWVMTRWWDLLACNGAYRDLTGDVQAGLAGSARNICRQSFTSPTIQEVYADWPSVAAWFASDLRISLAAWPTDAVGADLVAELRRTSRRFAQLWDQPEQAPERRITFAHRLLGTIELDVVRLTKPETSRQYVVALVPPDESTRALLETLAH